MTLKEELEVLRGEPIEVFTGNALDIPCIETSNAERLCRHPVVSVQMITYNHEAYIRQAIEGVMMQKTDFEFELVIGEDCSQDKTREICFEYQKKYPDKIRVLWWHENVSKLGGNGRRTRARCRGEFVALCEGDDYWIDPLKLQKQIDVMRKYPNVGFCFCGAVDYYQSTARSEDFDALHSIPVGMIRGRDYLEMNLFGRGIPPKLQRESFVRTATVMIRTADLYIAMQRHEILSWRLRLGDVPLWLSLSTVSDVYFLADKVATYRINEGGACARFGSILGKDNIFSRIYFLLTEYRQEGLKRQRIKLLQDRYFSMLLDSNRKSSYVKSYVKYIFSIMNSRFVCFMMDWSVVKLIFLHYLRYECWMLRPVGKIYRKLLGHGEYAN